MNAGTFRDAVRTLAPVVAKIPDAVERLHAWFEGGEAPIDVLAELPELPDLSRGDLEFEAMKQRAKASGSSDA